MKFAVDILICPSISADTNQYTIIPPSTWYVIFASWLQTGPAHDAGDLPYPAPRAGPLHQAAAAGLHLPVPGQGRRAAAHRRRHRGRGATQGWDSCVVFYNEHCFVLLLSYLLNFIFYILWLRLRNVGKKTETYLQRLCSNVEFMGYFFNDHCFVLLLTVKSFYFVGYLITLNSWARRSTNLSTHDIKSPRLDFRIYL